MLLLRVGGWMDASLGVEGAEPCLTPTPRIPHRFCSPPTPSPFPSAHQTRDVVDAQGWMHTGDVGLWLPGGRLKIIDRWGVGLEGGL